MITVVLTSCGRVELLKRTIDSFNKFNTYPITDFIIVDDSGNSKVHQEIKKYYSDYNLILELKNRGQIICIDDAYSKVKTLYIFHCEDDWEFTKSGFIEPSLKILEQEKTIMQIWILWGNKHPVEPEVFKAGDIQYRLLGHDINNWWHGFTFNPGLRRLSDWQKIGPYMKIGIYDESRLKECEIGQEFYKQGYRAAILNDEYCHHIGGVNTTK